MKVNHGESARKQIAIIYGNLFDLLHNYGMLSVLIRIASMKRV